MAFYFSQEEAVQGKFLFISYSHAVQGLVEKAAASLTGRGVRLFYDKAFTPGDEWSKDVEMLLRHQNCCGAILFCDVSAIKSPNVAKERAVIADVLKERGNDKYHIFIVNVSQTDKRASYMQLLKRVFDSLEESTIDNFFKLDALAVFMSFVSGDPISCDSCDADFADKLMAAISKKLPEVIDEKYLVLKTIGEKNVIFGKYAAKPIEWRFLHSANGIVSFISANILATREAGGSLDEWFENDFKKQCFTPDQAEMLSDTIRLLTEQEAVAAEKSILAVDGEWWLSDRTGALQEIVRKDGTIYGHGYHNRNHQKGVRPVITIPIEKVKELIK